MNQGRSPRRMKTSSSHNITTITITIIMVGAGMGPSSWCLDIVITITTIIIITATIAATIESSLCTIEKQDPRVLFFVCCYSRRTFSFAAR